MPSSTHSRRRQPQRPTSDWFRPPAQFPWAVWLATHWVLVSLFAVLLVALLAEMPWMPRPIRSLLLSADVVLVCTLIAAAGPAAGRLSLAAAGRGPNIWLLGVLAWSAFSAVNAPYHAFAIAELLRLALGAGIYFAAAYVLRPAEVRLLPLFLICLGAAVGLYELTQFGQSLDSSGVATNSIFGNHEQLGSFLTLLLAPALALALDRKRSTGLLLIAQGAAVVIGAALLLARTRSAWAGAAASLLLLSALLFTYSSVRLTRSNRFLLIGPALLVVLGFGGLLLFGQLAPLVSARAATFSHALDDTSLSDRLHRWRSACRMASERPITGWGLGSWPVMEGRWTHQGDDDAEVLSGGTGHSNLAHNFWVQWAAETGGVGLALYLGFLASFFVSALSALPRLDHESRALLIASLAGAAAGIVDMIGAPSYTFPGVSSLFFVWLGLGQAVMGQKLPRPNSGEPDKEEAGSARSSGSPKSPGSPELGRGSFFLPPVLGLSGALFVLGIGDTLRAGGQGVPRGTLLLTTTPPGPVAPGTRVLWTATYRAPDGTLRPTAPGTVWTTDAGRLEKTSPTFLSVNRDPQRAGWQGNIPSGIGLVTVTAHYWDRFSRPYVVSRTVQVK